MTYDFTRLSGPDFEEIVHDLLQVDWKTELEIFAGGRDGGIDLRRIDDDGLLIVQCKNYEGSGFSTLRGKMRDDELPKIRAKKPDRYVLVTSVDLTVGQKDELLKLLTPWVKTPGDIIGKKELTAKLGSHPQVVRRHHKLWLTSVAVMEKILIGAELLQTTAAVAKMVQKLNVYVETDALPRAVDILERHHVLIVSGEPGIGKSTLADMIMLDHIANGFQPAVIRGSLNEGRAIAAAGNPTIFYFDDFLGQTYLGDRPDFLGKREDADLVEFIHWVRTSKDHRFVLTTREHVLSEAMMRSERLRQGTLSDDKCLITVKDLNRAQRARILYNHLEFSSLPLEYKIEMLRGDFFLEVIDFERYSPRVIQWLSSYNRLQSVPVAEYQHHIRRLMANPLEIWRHAFTYELSQAARDILIALYSFTYRAYVDDAERCFDRLHETSIKRLNAKTKSGAFRSAMKELEGSFVTISRKGEVNFINPSIADFVASVLNDDPQLVVDLINSAIYFTQVSMLIEGAEPGGPLPNVMPRLKRNIAEVSASFDRLLEAPHLKWFDSREGRAGHYVDMSPTSRASRLIELREIIPEIGPVSHRMIASVAHDIEHNAIQLNEVRHLLKSAWGSDQALADMSEVIRSVRKGFRYAYAEDWLAIMDLRSEIGSKFDDHLPDASELFQKYLDERLADEIYDCDSVNAASNLEYVLERLQERHGAKVGYEITQVAERLVDLEMNEETRGSETSDDFFGTSHGKAAETSDDAIKSMFGGLLG